MNAQQIATIFRYHAPHGDQAQRYERLRAAGGELATLIAQLCPESGERVLAIRRVQEAVMYANAAIACNEPKPPAAATDLMAPTCNAVCVCTACGKPIDIAAGVIVTTDSPAKNYHPSCLSSARDNVPHDHPRRSAVTHA